MKFMLELCPSKPLQSWLHLGYIGEQANLTLTRRTRGDPVWVTEAWTQSYYLVFYNNTTLEQGFTYSVYFSRKMFIID